MVHTTKEDIDAFRERLLAVVQEAGHFFATLNAIKERDDDWPLRESWRVESEADRRKRDALGATIKSLSIDIAGAARRSPLLADADMQELRHSTRQMLANIRLQRYHHTGVYVHHDEDRVLGVDPPSHEEVAVEDVPTAHRLFDKAGLAICDLVDLLCPTDTEQGTTPDSANYRPNTAFVMMALDDSKPELEDVREGIRSVFKEFGISAITADEIEHEEAITDRILDEIERSEFLIADLTYERPNVYYEIGHAHARNKRVMLFCREGTNVHFDVAHRNCPVYKNTEELKRLLRKRLESATNRLSPSKGR